jgi:hypothetical protein
MSRDVTTTRYFAVGFFTAAQLEEKHRGLLARAQSDAAVAEIRSAVEVVWITVFNVNTGAETVDMGIDKLSMIVQDAKVETNGASFAIERFDSNVFPGTLTPEDAFKQYLASPKGMASFGTATAVQLFGINVAVRDLAKS